MSDLLRTRDAVVAFQQETEAADTPVRARQAGWFADPELRAASRFWDGERWTEYTRGPAPRSAAIAPPRTYGETRHFGVFTNTPAAAAVVLGGISLLLNPLFLTSAIAVGLAAVGLRRSVKSPTHQGRLRSVVGMLLGSAGVLTGVVIVSVAIPVFLGAQQQARMDGVRSAIRQDAQSHGVYLASVTCPEVDPESGVVFECRAATPNHERIVVHVRVDPRGTEVAERPATH